MRNPEIVHTFLSCFVHPPLPEAATSFAPHQMVVLGIVGGSSLVTFDPKHEFGSIGLDVTEASDVCVENAYGKVKMRRFELKGANAEHTLFFMQRHSHDGGGITPPHRINYKANMRALVDMGVDAIVATTSVGAAMMRSNLAHRLTPWKQKR